MLSSQEFKAPITQKTLLPRCGCYETNVPIVAYEEWVEYFEKFYIDGEEENMKN
jgi:hypothetical protein